MYKSSSQSLQNALMLLLFVIGLFIIYRYVKTLEGEVKLVQNHLIELVEQMRVISETTLSQQQCPLPPPLRKQQAKQESVESNNGKMQGGGSDDKEEEDNDCCDDNESVKSEDITDILRQVINNSILEDDEQIVSPTTVFGTVFKTNEEPNELDIAKCTLTEIEDNEQEEEEDEPPVTNKNVSSPPRSINIDGDDENEAVESNVKDTLLKKTNEELKGILKNHQLSVKGTKNELVERILENNIY